MNMIINMKNTKFLIIIAFITAIPVGFFAFKAQTPFRTLMTVPDTDRLGEADNGKTFTYTPTSRFSTALDEKKHPLKDLRCEPDNIIGYVSNLSVNGPDNYPIGFEAVSNGTCTLKDGDFSVTIHVSNN